MRFPGLFAILVIATISACRDNADVTIPNEKIAGSYKTTVWMIPGPADGGVDVHAAGGFIEAQLAADFGVTGRVVAPAGILTSHGEVDEAVSGTYVLKGDTVDFEVAFFPDHAQWHPAESTIETFEVPPRGRPYKIILVKQ